MDAVERAAKERRLAMTKQISRDDVERMRGLLAESLPYLDREAERQRQAINANLGSSREGWRAAVNLRARIYEAIKQLED